MGGEDNEGEAEELDQHELHHAFVDVLEVPLRDHALEDVGRERDRRREPGGLLVDRDQDAESGKAEAALHQARVDRFQGLLDADHGAGRSGGAATRCLQA